MFYFFFNEPATPEIYTVLTHSFPTRRSSDLKLRDGWGSLRSIAGLQSARLDGEATRPAQTGDRLLRAGDSGGHSRLGPLCPGPGRNEFGHRDRKSTRLNSSH